MRVLLKKRVLKDVGFSPTSPAELADDLAAIYRAFFAVLRTSGGRKEEIARLSKNFA